MLWRCLFQAGEVIRSASTVEWNTKNVPQGCSGNVGEWHLRATSAILSHVVFVCVWSKGSADSHTWTLNLAQLPEYNCPRMNDALFTSRVIIDVSSRVKIRVCTHPVTGVYPVKNDPGIIIRLAQVVIPFLHSFWCVGTVAHSVAHSCSTRYLSVLTE